MARSKPATCTRHIGVTPGRTPRHAATTLRCGAPAVATLVNPPTDRDTARCLAHLPPLETPRWQAERALERVEYQVKYAQRSYERYTAQVQARLTEAAARVGQYAASPPDAYHRGAVSIASQIIGEVTSLVGNAGLNYLAEYAAEYETARAALATAQAAVAALEVAA